LQKKAQNQIITADLSWNEQGEPTSTQFGDIYFSTTDGMAESYYVFIEQNKLLDRWAATTQSFYVIGETGFGSGLNFLVTWQAFASFRSNNPNHPLRRLYFTSFEKYPLEINDLINSHARWTDVKHNAAMLQHQYPLPVAGCHRLTFPLKNTFDAQIILDLWIGDIKDTITTLSHGENGLIDSWFLDGFAPSKNPEMWNQSLYNNMAKLSANNATMATFTAAGDVRRGLIKAGFLMTKTKGFGKKREMLTGRFERADKISAQNPWFFRPGLQDADEHSPVVTIIGGGIASASIVLALSKRQIKCRLICKDSVVAQGASGNRQGGFYPLLNSNHDPLSSFYSQAFCFGLSMYRPFIESDPSSGDFCGVFQVAYNEKIKSAQQKLIASQMFTPLLVKPLTEQQATLFTGVPMAQGGLLYPAGGWLSPLKMTQNMLLNEQESGLLQIIYNTKVTELTNHKNQWRLKCCDNTTLNAEIVILTNGHELANFEQTQQLPLYATSGQVSHLRETEHTAPLTTVLCYQGYMTPSAKGVHCIGASFNRDISSYDVNDQEHHQNISKLTSDLPELFQGTLSQRTISQGKVGQDNTLTDNIVGGKVGVRMSVKDHMPMVGAVPHYDNTRKLYHDLNKGKPAISYTSSPVHTNLFMLGGLGSRGLCSAPILGEILACQLLNEPMPIDQHLLNQLNPNRYWIKQLKKHHVDI